MNIADHLCPAALLPHAAEYQLPCLHPTTEMHTNTKLPIPQKQGCLYIAHAIMAAFLCLPERPAAKVACSVGQPLCMPLLARSFALCAQTSEVGQRQDRQNARGLGESRALLQGVQLGQLAETLPVPT